MQKNPLVWNIFGVLSLVAVLCFLYAAVSALDRVRFALEEIRGELRELQSRPAAAPAGTVLPQSDSAIRAANAEFFDPKAVPGGRIIQATGADAGNLNYIVNNDAGVSEYWSKAMDTLADLQYDNPEKHRPMLAESWTVSDDRLTYHIKLRKGILWHDFTDPVTKKEWSGVPVTAADFKFYLDVVKDETVDAAPLRGYLQDIDRIDVRNEYEFDVIWRKPYFKSADITLGLQPLPRHLYAPDGKFDGKRFNDDHARNRILVGCGPYQFVRWEKGKRVLFKRFEKYYGRSLGIMPPVKQLAYDVIKHPNTRLQALVSGDLDLDSLTPDQWLNNTNGPAFGENGHLRKIKYPGFSYNYIGLNLKNPLFQDRRVRVALSHLIDRDRIVRDVYSGLARPVSGPFFPDSASSDPAIKPYPFSVETAKKLLAEAGWKDTDGDGILDKDGKPFQFTILNPNVNTTYQKLLPIIKEDMAKAGIRAESLSLEWSVVLERIEKRAFDSCMIAWLASPNRPDPFQLWHSSHTDNPASSNFISFRNPEADRLIEQIRTTPDDLERTELYRQFHRLIHAEAPYLFLFSPYSLLAVNRRYQNVRVFPTGVPDRLFWTPSAAQKIVPGF